MQEPREQDLILYFYGEARNAAEIRRRLDASPAARQRYDELCRLLEAVEAQPVPEPDAGYGERVWRRLQPGLERPSTAERLGRWLAELLAPRRLATAGALAAMLLVAFAAGRYWPGGDASPAALPAAGRERILLVAVGEHLERSEMLLIELANAPGGGAVDLSGELERAADLLPDNRLYRQAADRSGQAKLAEVLEDLERLLLDVAHSSGLSAEEREDLRRRIEGDGILFRVQVLGSRAQRHDPIIPPPEPSGEV